MSPDEKYLPYPQNHPHYVQGVEDERNRILALVQGEGSAAFSLDYLVDLINGVDDE